MGGKKGGKSSPKGSPKGSPKAAPTPAPVADRKEELDEEDLVDKFAGEDEDPEPVLGEQWDASEEKKSDKNSAQPLPKVGQRVKALYVEDGKYYEAEVRELLPGGKVLINYTEYDEDAELTLNQLRMKKEPKASGGSQSQALSKRKQAQKAEEEARRARALAEQQANDPDAASRRKAEERKRVEEADNALTDELFGNVSAAPKSHLDIREQEQDGFGDPTSKGKKGGAVEKVVVERGIQDFELALAEDYAKFAKEIGRKLTVTSPSDSKSILKFLNTLLPILDNNITQKEMNDLKNTVTTAYNAKTKKLQNAKKGKNSSMLNLGGKTGKLDGLYDDYGGVPKGDADYDDFM